MGYKMKKIKKMIKNPNLFFYDLFKKRINKHINNENINKQPIICHDSISFEKILYNLVEFNYKGKLYIKEKQKLIFLLYQASTLNYNVRIVTDFSKCYKYNSNIASYENLSKALTNVDNAYIELSDYKNNKIACYDVVFTVCENNIYYSNSDVRRISRVDINELKKEKSDFDIDIVYTYVDAQDPSWRAMYEETFDNLEYDAKRYETHDELKFSLRSVNQFMPWVHKIYIVSNCAKPQWLNDSSRIVWVDHSEIVTNTNLIPMFNSHAIESYLHKIPNLSENFIYFNDDILVNKQVDKSFFYKHKNISINFCEQYDSVFWDFDTITDSIGYKYACKNVQTILYDKFKYIPRYLMQHAPHSLKKSVLYELENLFYYQFDIVRKNKIRSIDDINILSFLYPHYSLLKGQSIHFTARTAIIRELNFEKIINNNYKYQFLCLNEYNESNMKFVNKIGEFLNKRFFVIPEWENAFISRKN